MDPGLPSAAELLARPGVCVIAHRGVSARAPENTIAAFGLAAKSGADGVELDYRHTRDGVPVVLHDADLDRTTDGAGCRLGAVAACDLATLRALDAGAWFDGSYAGARIPTLEEALEVICPRQVAVIERKAGDPDTLLELLTRRGWLERVVVQSFDPEFLAACRALAPDLVLGGLGQGALTEQRLAQGAGLGVAVAGWHQADLDASVVAAAKARGLRVWAWTVNGPDRARALIEAGVDGLIGDDPQMLRRVVDAHAAATPGSER